MVERGLKDSERPVGRRPPRPHGIDVLGVNRGFPAVLREAGGARKLGRSCERGVPIFDAPSGQFRDLEPGGSDTRSRASGAWSSRES